MANPISPDQLPELAALTDWCVQPGLLRGRFRATSFEAAGRFVAAVAAVADEVDHHPDIDLRYPAIVQIVVTSHDAGGLTRRDTRLASTLSALAADAGLTAEPDTTQALTVVIEVDDPDRVLPFWQAVLGYRASTNPDGDAMLVDARRFDPGVVVRRRTPSTPTSAAAPTATSAAETGATPGRRLQVDLAHPVALARATAGSAAGGSVLAADPVAGRWVVADPEGNEVNLTGWPGPRPTAD